MDYEIDHIATPQEACREYARNVGAERPHQAWILTDWDSWEPNPFYHGPACPHPEFDDDDQNIGPIQPLFETEKPKDVDDCPF